MQREQKYFTILLMENYFFTHSVGEKEKRSNNDKSSEENIKMRLEKV